MSALPSHEVVATRDRLGVRRVPYVPLRGECGRGVAAPSIRELIGIAPEARLAGLDRAGVAASWGEREEPGRTCLAAVAELAPGHVLVRDAGGVLLARRSAHAGQTIEAGCRPADEERSRARALDLDHALVDAARRSLRGARSPVALLGGGIDAPLAVLAARRAGVAVDRALTIAAPGTSYDERAQALANARALGLALEIIEVDAHELAGALPDAVAAAECAFYNLHPVSRVLLARAAARRGHDAVLTGDGADEACRAAEGLDETADYLPHVGAIVRAHGLVWAAPFVEAELVRALEGTPEAPTSRPKEALRGLAVAWGLPRELSARPKASSWAPPLPRLAFPSRSVVDVLARALDRPLAWSGDDRLNTGIASVACLAASLELHGLGPVAAERR